MDNMNKKKTFVKSFIVVTAVLTSVSFLSFNVVQNGLTEEIQEYFPQSYRIVSPELPKEISFAGEPVPLEKFEVKERLDREMTVGTYWHSAMILYLKRANRWFPVIEPILKKNGIPDDVKYISLIESDLTHAVSPVGATGFWQFMKPTAIKYGLEVNEFVDERYHVEKATEAACLYLKDAKTKFGTWTLAASSYNMGQNGTDNQLERQKADSYYNLVLSEETTRYIFRALAVKTIMSDPAKYGYQINAEDLYPQLDYKIVSVNTEIKHWADFAASHGINYKTLKYYNPWLRDNYLPNKSKKTYEVKIPVGKGVK